MRPITKQLKSVTARPVPAPARMRPAGRKAKSAIASRNALAQRARPRLGSAAAAAFATRAQVSSMLRSTHAAVGRLQPVLHVPDLLGDAGQDCWTLRHVRCLF